MGKVIQCLKAKAIWFSKVVPHGLYRACTWPGLEFLVQSILQELIVLIFVMVVIILVHCILFGVWNASAQPFSYQMITMMINSKVKKISWCSWPWRSLNKSISKWWRFGFFFFISLNVSTSKQENGYEWGLRDWICRPTTHYWRTLTHDLCSNQPRMVKTWSMTVSFPIFAPSQNRPEKAKCFPNESCKMPFLVSLPPATPCQPPLITAYLEPLHTFFLLYQAFPLLCQPFESLSKTSESGSLLL